MGRSRENSRQVSAVCCEDKPMISPRCTSLDNNTIAFNKDKEIWLLFK